MAMTAFDRKCGFWKTDLVFDRAAGARGLQSVFLPCLPCHCLERSREDTKDVHCPDEADLFGSTVVLSLLNKIEWNQVGDLCVESCDT